jgi:multidrug resistance efflux pump
MSQQQEFARAVDLVEKGAGMVQRQQQTRSDLQAQQANTERAKTAVTAAQVGIKTLQAQQQQVDFLAYIDVFWTLATVAVLMIPTAAVLRPIDLGAPARGH